MGDNHILWVLDISLFIQKQLINISNLLENQSDIQKIKKDIGLITLLCNKEISQFTKTDYEYFLNFIFLRFEYNNVESNSFNTSNYQKWITDKLYDFAQSWDFYEIPEDENQQESTNTNIFINNLAETYQLNNCRLKDYDNIIFQFWQFWASDDYL